LFCNNFSVVNDEYSVSAWFKSNNNNYEPRNFAIPNNNLGFGVEGNISGASGELGANSTGTEVIRVDFNVPQLYINVTFGWKNPNEDAYLTFYLNNQQEEYNVFSVQKCSFLKLPWSVDYYEQNSSP